MLWVKAFHIVFVMSWFAGLFYVPRIFVNLAELRSGPAYDRLVQMARRLYRFTSWLGVVAMVLGLILFLYYGIGLGTESHWMHAKLGVVVLILGYQHACGSLLRKFERGENGRSHVWYRYFNEVPVLMLVAAVCLVVVKPF